MRRFAISLVACGALIAACGGDPAGGEGTDNPGGDGGKSGDSSGGHTGAGGKKAEGGSGGTPDTSSGGSPAAGGDVGTGSGGTPAAGGSAAGGDTGSGGSGDVDASVPDDAAAPPTGGSSGGSSKVFNGVNLDNWNMVPAASWVVKDGAMVSTGNGRGYVYPKDVDCVHCRILFSLKPGGTGGHQPTVLIFTTRPPPALDAMGGIQFQPPNGSHWDYRPGKNTAGAGFTKIGGPGPPVNGWNICEIIANSMTGEAKMACGGKDVVHYKDPTAGKKFPFAIQTHNKGITDAYKDISIEEVTADDYVTVK
jgi:hypothetical protein